MGDLVSGEVDLGVAAIIQTSEKAEVIYLLINLLIYYYLFIIY